VGRLRSLHRRKRHLSFATVLVLVAPLLSICLWVEGFYLFFFLVLADFFDAWVDGGVIRKINGLSSRVGRFVRERSYAGGGNKY